MITYGSSINDAVSKSAMLDPEPSRLLLELRSPTRRRGFWTAPSIEVLRKRKRSVLLFFNFRWEYHRFCHISASYPVETGKCM